MKKEKKTITTAKSALANAKAKAKKQPRSERATLGLLKPLNGDLRRGWCYCLQTKKGLTVLGEVDLANKINGAKTSKPGVLERANVRTMEIARVIGTGWDICQKTAYVPARPIALFGEGASRAVKLHDAATKKFAEARAALAEANAALIKATVDGGTSKSIAKAAAAVKAAAAIVRGNEEAEEAEKKSWRKMNDQALAVSEKILDLRRGV